MKSFGSKWGLKKNDMKLEKPSCFLYWVFSTILPRSSLPLYTSLTLLLPVQSRNTLFHTCLTPRDLNFEVFQLLNASSISFFYDHFSRGYSSLIYYNSLYAVHLWHVYFSSWGKYVWQKNSNILNFISISLSFKLSSVLFSRGFSASTSNENVQKRSFILNLLGIKNFFNLFIFLNDKQMFLKDLVF